MATENDSIRIAIVVARAENGTIGDNNALPWHLPKDLQHFKQVTMGHPVLMGRKTFESIGRALPGRNNIVVTRQADWQKENTIVVHSLDQGLKKARQEALKSSLQDVMVIGGEKIYEQALPQTQRLYLTEVHAEVDGDAKFPAIDFADWLEIDRVTFSADSRNPYSYSFVTLDRRN